MAINTVAVIVQDGAEPFGLGALCEVWAEPYHPDDDNPVFDFHVVTPRPGRVRGASGYDLHVDEGLDLVETADLVCVAPKRGYLEPDDDVSAAVVDAHERGATIFAHCTGAFTLGQAGLLDGIRCTTHWRHSAELARLYPRAEVDPDVLFVHAGRIVTGAGSAASLDACLHLLRMQFGARTAAATARRMVVPPQRDGGQAQFIVRPVAECRADTLQPVVDWALAHLDADLSVEALAGRAHMSVRTFARRFREETGATPHQWVTEQRIRAAEQLLETSDHPVELIAGRAGFGNAAQLRHHFARSRGVSPQQYRRAFAG